MLELKQLPDGDSFWTSAYGIVMKQCRGLVHELWACSVNYGPVRPTPTDKPVHCSASMYSTHLVTTFIAELQTANAAVQKGMTRVLGYVASKEFPQAALKAIECLMGVIRHIVGLPHCPISPLIQERSTSLESKVHTVWRHEGMPTIHLPF